MLRHMDRMRRERPFRQDAQRVQILHRRHAAMLFLASVEFRLRLGNMNM